MFACAVCFADKRSSQTVVDLVLRILLDAEVAKSTVTASDGFASGQRLFSYRPRALALSPDGSTAAVCLGDKCARLYSIGGLCVWSAASFWMMLG